MKRFPTVEEVIEGYKAADVLSVEVLKTRDELADALRKLDVALLQERTTRAELTDLKKSVESQPAPDPDDMAALERHIDGIVGSLVQGTAIAVETRAHGALDHEPGGKVQAQWRLT